MPCALVRSAPSTSIRPRSSSLTRPYPAPEPFDIGAATGGDHDIVGLTGLVTVLELHRAITRNDVRYQRAGVNGDPLLLEATLRKL